MGMRAASGSLFGLAYGDSLGRPTEFQDYGSIVAAYGVAGPQELTGHPARVTDDTQMALAVGEALLEARTFTPESWNRCCAASSSPGSRAPTTLGPPA